MLFFYLFLFCFIGVLLDIFLVQLLVICNMIYDVSELYAKARNYEYI